MISLEHRGPPEVRLGLVYADGLCSTSYPIDFEPLLEELLRSRKADLPDSEDLWRRHVRDMLRSGRFKPTGRGKPASEYLLGAARKGAFPRINSIVDVCNYISLKYLLPISVWDVDRGGGADFMIRLGKSGESYVFNRADQTINLEDLVVGCRMPESDSAGSEHSDGSPIVNPVKDSMDAKTIDSSRRVAALVYAPAVDAPGLAEADPSAASLQRLSDATIEFEQLYSECGSDVGTTSGLLESGTCVEFRLPRSVDRLR